jgi:hypothetical protein
MHATNFMVLNIFIVVLAITLVFATGFIVRAALNLAATPNKRLQRLAGELLLVSCVGELLNRSVRRPALLRYLKRRLTCFANPSRLCSQL